MSPEGHSGWDAYARYYDWENARTFGRRDVPFWRRLVRAHAGPVLELGCGTGRLLMPLAVRGRAPARVSIVGVDRSAAMLARARVRARRRPRRLRPALVLGDIRNLPFADRSFGVIIAPYGLVQSLLTDRDLDRALADAARVLRRDGLLGLDLVPDLPAWPEHGPQVRLNGRTRDGAAITLVESVRQDRRRRRTIFHEQFFERRGSRSRRRRFSLTFRTLPLQRLLGDLARAGFRIEATMGDYRGRPLSIGAETWLILARKQ